MLSRACSKLMIESSTDSDLVDDLTEVELGLPEPRWCARVGDPIVLDVLGEPAIEAERGLEQALAEVLHLGLLEQELSGDSSVVLADRIERELRLLLGELAGFTFIGLARVSALSASRV